MDTEEAYRWGQLFNQPWEPLVVDMARRAETLGLEQEENEGILVWRKGGHEEARWVFVNDARDVESVRSVFANEDNVRSPSCFVVVRQLDPSEERGDVIFDIFRLSPHSYLWHFNRVFTPPRKRQS